MTIRSERRRWRIRAALALALVCSPGRVFAQSAPPDALRQLRERFRDGMEKYKSADYSGAIVIWESVYRELGSDQGYRLAFDLARAYDELGEHIKAAEHYETYLEKVATRRTAGETLEPNVTRQEDIARERLDSIAHEKGRIRIDRPDTPTMVRIDNGPARIAGTFVTYVEPGAHTIVLGQGEDEEVQNVTVAKGAMVTVTKTTEPRITAPPAPTSRTEARETTHVEHPFSSAWLWASGGAAALSLALPVVTYSNALSIKSEYDDPRTSFDDKVRLSADYENARSNAYVSAIVPTAFVVTAAALTVWYVVASKEKRAP